MPLIPMPQSVAGLSSTFAGKALERSVAPGPLAGVVKTAAGTTPRAIDRFGGYTWGFDTGVIYRSSDFGANWTSYCAAPAGADVVKLIPTSDGEVILANAGTLRRSTGWSTGSPTWTTKITPLNTAIFTQFNVSGDGTKFIATQYDGTTRTNSRYGHISTDSGVTWTQVWDSNTKFGNTLADASHIHGCAYDPWSGRFYISEGHDDGGSEGDIAGIYYSADNGSTWTRASGMAQNPSPMVVCPTDDGLVCGADNARAGVYGVIRQDDPTLEALTQLVAWNTVTAGVIAQAFAAFRDPDTGMVYLGYKPITGVAPIITGGTATTHELLWEGVAAVSAGDGTYECVVKGDKMLATVYESGTRKNLTARIPKAAPGAKYVRTGTTGDNTTLVAGRTASAGKLATKGVVVGQGAQFVQGIRGLAIGYQAVAQGSTSSANNIVAIGPDVKAYDGSVIVGTNLDGLTTPRTNATVVGTGCAVTGNNVVIVGAGASAAGASVAIGQGATANNSSSTALGSGVATTANNQVALGGKHVELTEITDPVAPTSTAARLYVKDDATTGSALYLRTATGTYKITMA